MKLTTKTIEALRPTGQRQEIKDDGCRGLYLLLQPSGAKSWAVRYSIDGAVRKHTLGGFPAIPLAEARIAATKIFSELRDGGDPREAQRQAAAEAKAARAATFGAIGRRFIADSEHKRSIKDIKRRLSPIIAEWEDRPVGTLKRRDIIALVDELKAARGPYAGVGALSWIKRVLNYAVEKAELEVSPAWAIKPPATPRVRERVLTDDELRRVWLACEKKPFPFGNYIKGLLLTACRRTELATLEWSDVDLDEQVIVIPPERYKTHRPHLIPLSRQAMALLQEQPRIGDDRWVFTATGRRPLNAYEKRMEWFRELLDPAIDFSLHDLRRTVRTNMSRLRVPPHIAERVLGHVQGGVEKHYDFHSYVDEKRLALQIWADHIEAVVSGQRGAVTPLLPRTMIGG